MTNEEIGLTILEKGMEFLQEDGTVMPTAFIFDSEEKCIAHLGMEFQSEEEKHVIASKLQDFAKRVNAFRVAVIADAWRAVYAAGEVESGDYVSPSERLDRVECLTVLVGTANDVIFITQDYTREGDEIRFGDRDTLNCIKENIWTNGIWPAIQ